MLPLLRLLAVALVLGLSVAACGGAEKDTGETVSAEAAAICDASPLSGSPKLPASFPKPAGVTYVKTELQGPTVVVDGTFDGGIDDGYAAYQKAVKKAAYSVLFNEKEEHDAEISYEGNNRSGQIALRDDCGGDKILVHITNRPA